jgi:hypothetical protein
MVQERILKSYVVRTPELVTESNLAILAQFDFRFFAALPMFIAEESAG